MDRKKSINFDSLKTFQEIHKLLEINAKQLIFLTKAEHKIKKKAEQLACENAIKMIELYITQRFELLYYDSLLKNNE